MFRYACPLVSLQYSVLDPDTLKRLHRSKKQQIEMERLANKVNVVAIVYFSYVDTENKLQSYVIPPGPEKACQP